MPKTLLEKVVFTIVMATIMVYGPEHGRRDQRHLSHGSA